MSIASVFILPILILAALALGVLVYYICYKAAINRKLRAEESGAHVPMASMESVWKVVAVIAVVVMYSSLNSKIMNLQQEQQNTTNRLYDEIMELRYELEEMQETAKKEASMLREVFYDFGEIDTETNSVEMMFRVWPKSYSGETDVTIHYGGEKIVLVNNGEDFFSGSKTFPLHEEIWEESMISITENGVTTTEVWEDAPKGSMLFECLPQLVNMQSSFGYEERKNKIAMEGDLYIMSTEKNLDSFQNLTFYVRKGHEILEEIPMNDGQISFDLSYEVEEGDRIVMYVKAVDQYGYIHEMYVSGWSNSGLAPDVSYDTSYKIYTPDGRELTQ